MHRLPGGGVPATLDADVAGVGRLDIGCANARIYTVQPSDQVSPQLWQDTTDTNLTRVWNTVVMAVRLIAVGGGRSSRPAPPRLARL